MYALQLKKNRIIYFFFISLIITQLPILSQVKFPGTPAGTRAKEIVDLFNAGDAAKTEDYVRENFDQSFIDAFPMEQHVGFFAMMKQQHKSLELAEINSSNDYDISMLLHSPTSGGWLNVQLWVNESEPYKVNRMGISPGSAPIKKNDSEKRSEVKKDSPPNEVTNEELTQYIDKVVNELIEKDEFSGSVLVAKDGKPIYEKAIGLAHKGFKVPNKINTKFNLGSMNKMFTGTAIMQLIQQGKLKLDDKVGKFLPDYPNKDVREKVTIHHLLTHTSGIGSYWLEYFSSPKRQIINSVQDYDNLSNKNPLQFEPGERFMYSNSGPLVLGLIIEKISGMSYYDYVDKYIYKPAKMINSGCFDVTTVVENMAVGYAKADPMGRPYDELHANYYINPPKGGPTGGGFSTVEDLLKFDIALRNNLLLDAEHFKTMTTGQIERNAERQYAYLFEEKFINGHRIIGHSGGAGGINSNLSMYMDLGYTVAVMSNYDPPSAMVIAGKIEELLTQ